MVSENSIINLSDLSKPATVLVKKISNAIGVLYEPRRIRKKAEAEAAAEKIKTLSRLELTEIQERGIERLVYQEGRKQENIESITAEAINELPPDAKTENLEEDWLAHFFDKCEKVSDKQMQSLWSSLLAGEATNPGTYSKRTIDLVASMDKKDAELFTRFCQFAWYIENEPVPLIFDVKDKVYTDNLVYFTTLQHLDSIGLISFVPTSDYLKKGFKKTEVIYYFNTPVVIEFSSDHNNHIEIGKSMFTQAGRELVAICGAKRNQGFYEYAVEKLFKQNLCMFSPLSI